MKGKEIKIKDRKKRHQNLVKISIVSELYL